MIKINDIYKSYKIGKFHKFVNCHTIYSEFFSKFKINSENGSSCSIVEKNLIQKAYNKK